MEITGGYKIALFGGTFDPLHTGHLDVLRAAHDEIDPDRIIVIPTGHSYMKEDAGMYVSPASDRIGMLEEGLKELDFPVEISRVETDREGPSYSVDTVRLVRKSVREEYDRSRSEKGDPKFDSITSDFFFLCGSDTLFNVEKWYEYRKLLEMIVLTVIPRGDDDLDSIMRKKHDLEIRDGARIMVTEFRGPDISSTYIREHIKESPDMIPEGTLEYIREHHLYGL